MNELSSDLSTGPGRAPAVGERAPDFELRLEDGRQITRDELGGQPVVLAFFPNEWDPARDAQVRQYEAGLRACGGNAHFLRVDGEGAPEPFEVNGVPSRFPAVTNLPLNSEIAARYGVADRQAIFVLDGDGTVCWRHIGPVGGHPPAGEIAQAVERAMVGMGISRRRLLATAIAASVAFALLPRTAHGEAGAERASEWVRTVSLHVNGRDRRLEIDPRVTLLDALRERLGLFGTKKGCDHGQCGACTVHVDGRRVNACLTLAMQAEGAKITTIEGLADGDRLHPVQAAFIKHDGFQCGYCTPGQIMSGVACIKEGHARTDDEIREYMSGNICRCGAYVGIVEAVKEARDQMGGEH